MSLLPSKPSSTLRPSPSRKNLSSTGTASDSGFFSEGGCESTTTRNSSPDLELDDPIDTVVKDPLLAAAKLTAPVSKTDRWSPRLAEVTLDELHDANTAGKCWIAVRGKVYNLTKFAARHPGGRNIILMAAGKDVTPLFETSHTEKEEKILSKFLVGTLVGKDFPQFPPPDAFSRTLKARVAAHFAANSIDPKHSPFSFFRYALTILLLLVTYAAQWSSAAATSSLAFWGLALFYGCLQVEVAVSFVHDGSHGSIGHNPAVWTALASCHDFINGTSSLLWVYQHVLSHHCYTNVEDLDVDIDTSEVDFRRMKSSQPWHSFYKNQAIYAPLVYVLLGTSVRIGDVFRAFVDKVRGPMKVNELTWNQFNVFWGGKAFFVATRLILPFMLLPGVSILKVIGAFALSDAVFSFVFGLISQASHAVDCVEWPTVDPTTGNIEYDWMRLQVETAQDYAHDSWLTTFLVGALNYQAVHHLFPQVAQPNVPGIMPIVKETAREFGVKYTIKPTLWQAVGGHIGLLRMMGEKPHTH